MLKAMTLLLVPGLRALPLPTSEFCAALRRERRLGAGRTLSRLVLLLEFLHR